MNTAGKDAAAAPKVQVAQNSLGVLTYLVAEPPEALPPVSPRELERAWFQAREAAIAEQDGPTRLFRFRGPVNESGAHDPGADVVDLALTDADARCWAAAVDAARGLDNLAGLSVCLRLLALVDLLARARWAAMWVSLRPDGAEIDAALLRAAATAPLTREARFDESALRAQLCRDNAARIGHDGPNPAPPTGAFA